jgi:hypothetical protein
LPIVGTLLAVADGTLQKGSTDSCGWQASRTGQEENKSKWIHRSPLISHLHVGKKN